MVCAVFYTHQISDACAGVCACDRDRTHQMEKTGKKHCERLHRFSFALVNHTDIASIPQKSSLLPFEKISNSSCFCLFQV